jgi:cell division protein FtsZ
MTNSNRLESEHEASNREPKIKIIGLGGAGSNAVDSLDLRCYPTVQLAAINTDAQALSKSLVAEKLMIGRSLTHGLGAGGEVDLGRAAAEADRPAIEQMLQGQDLIILIVGLGGGTGSAVAPVVAQIAAKTNALLLVFATLPFSFEGARRQRIAEVSLGELRQLVHGVIPLPNDVLLQEGDEDTSVLNAFAVADQWIGRGVHALCAMLLEIGLINQDMSSLHSVFHALGGRAIFGTGTGRGENYVQQALEQLFICPLLHLGDRPSKLDRIIVNVIGGPDLGISRVNEIMTTVSQRFDSREDIVFGALINPQLSESLEICVLGKADMETRQPVQPLEPIKRANLFEGGLNLGSEISRDSKGAPKVHQTKLSSQPESAVDQDEFLFVDGDVERGYFTKTDRNDYGGEDLDVPTFMRRGIKIRLK